MSGDDTAKVTPARLRRDAYLYIRQSTLYQVIHNTESTGRQYDLKHRAAALGWPEDKIHVIDIDQGHSGASRRRPGRVPAPGRRGLPGPGRHRPRPGMLPAGPRLRRLAAARQDLRPHRHAHLRRGRPV